MDRPTIVTNSFKIYIMYIDKFKMEDGTYKNEEGVSFKDAKSFISISVFGICGCSGEEWVEIIVKTLIHFNTWIDTGKYWGDLVKDVYLDNESAAYIVANLLDNKGFIEHGTAIRGSWITDKGKELLSDIQEIFEIKVAL